jgi:hypothetical protein
MEIAMKRPWIAVAFMLAASALLLGCSNGDKNLPNGFQKTRVTTYHQDGRTGLCFLKRDVPAKSTPIIAYVASTPEILNFAKSTEPFEKLFPDSLYMADSFSRWCFLTDNNGEGAVSQVPCTKEVIAAMPVAQRPFVTETVETPLAAQPSRPVAPTENAAPMDVLRFPQK